MNNSSLLTPSHASPTSPSADSAYCVGYITAFAVISIIILLGNTITMLIFMRVKALRKKSYLLLLSLCVSDFLMGVYAAFYCSGFMFYCRVLDARYHSALAKDVMQWFFYIPFFASLHTITAISIERFLAVLFPFYYRTVGIGIFVALLAVPWLLAAFFAATSLVLVRVFNDQSSANIHLMWITALLCLVIIIIAYLAILIKVKRSHVEGTAGQNQAIRDRRLAVTVFLVTVASVVTWSPWISLQPIYLFCPKCIAAFKPEYWYIFQLFVFVNSAINIVIYAGRMPVFRKALVSMICKGKVRGSFIFYSGSNGQGTRETRHHEPNVNIELTDGESSPSRRNKQLY